MSINRAEYKRFARFCLTVISSIILICPVASADWIYTVRPGDNLWDLTARYLRHMGYVPRLQSRNNIADPYKIPPGTKIRVPVSWLKLQPALVRAVNVSGEVTYRRASDRALVPVVVGQEFTTGDEIITAAGANVKLEFADGSTFVMREASQLLMDSLSAYGESGMVDTRMRLQRGRIKGDVNPAAGDSNYEVYTPAAATAVRGTDYRLGYSIEELVLRTEVLDGTVAVRGSGVSRSVRRNTGTVTRVGEPPEPPRRLLPAPAVASIATLYERVPLRISWQALRGAAGYRLQIAATPAFNTLLFDNTSDSNQIVGPDLPDGDYFMRLRGIDNAGLEGADAVLAFRVNARPEPPVIITPQAGQIVRLETPVFAWAQPDDAVSYHVQIARSEDFAAALVDIGAYQEVELEGDPVLEPGDYVWRVATRDTSGEIGPFSDPQPFNFQPTPTPETEIGETEISFVWPEGLPGERYRFQLSLNPSFTKIVHDVIVDESRVTLPRPGSAWYYLRIAVIDAAGQQAAFGKSQRITLPIQDYRSFIILTVIGVILAL